MSIRADCGWEEVCVRDLQTEKGLVGGPFGSSLGRRDYRDVGVPVIRGVNLSAEGRFEPGGFTFVSQEKVEGELARNTAIPGDLIFTQRGTLGQVGIVPRDYPLYVISQSQMRLRVNPDRFDPLFIYYAFRTPAVVAAIESRAIATGVPHINLGILGDLKIRVPDVSVQRAIAALLGALDDKIDCNRRLAKAAVGLAREEFARVREADMVIARLGEVAAVNRESRSSDAQGTIEYIDISAVKEGSLTATTRYESQNAPSRARRRVFGGDTIWSNVRPNRRSYLLIVDPPSEFVVSTGFTTLTPTAIGPAFLHCAVTTDSFVEYLTASATGSAYPAVKASTFEQAPIAIPDADDLKAFETVAWTFLKRAHHAHREAKALAEIRDALLPRLMSGAVRVPEVEAHVAAVT